MQASKLTCHARLGYSTITRDADSATVFRSIPKPGSDRGTPLLPNSRDAGCRGDLQDSHHVIGVDTRVEIAPLRSGKEIGGGSFVYLKSEA